MPPFVKQIVGVFVRAFVVWLAGYLAAEWKIALTEDQVGQIVAVLVPVLATVAWSVWQKRTAQMKLLTALSSSKPLTEHQVEQLVKDPDVPTPCLLTRKHDQP